MGNSRVFEKWVPSMMNTDFESMGKTGMAAMKKDLSIALESAKEFSPRPRRPSHRRKLRLPWLSVAALCAQATRCQ